MQAFDEAAQAQINFLKQYVKEHETQYSYGYGSSRKQITIDSKSMDDFYELYSNDATECIDLQFADEDRQEIGLRIDMQEDFFVITTLAVPRSASAWRKPLVLYGRRCSAALFLRAERTAA